MADVDLVLPCLNEAAALPWVLSRVPEGYRAIVVDNGSTDGSAEAARAAGATVISEPRRGFGARQASALLGAGLTVKRLRPLRDVDLAQDAIAVAAEIPHSRFARAVARATAQGRAA